MYHPNIGLRKL